MDFSVAICTYNGAVRIPEVLECLLLQTQTDKLQWEVLVIDNNSDDETAKVVSDYAQRWRKDCTLRYIFESQQGLTHARQRAIEEAHSDLIGFLDDDNLPNPNWVIEAYQFGQAHPQAGAYGGIIQAKLDTLPPPDFDRIKIYLSVYDRGNQAFCYEKSAKPRRVPTGSGCVVRKQAWQECVPEQLQLSGRDVKNQTLLGNCEDLEALYQIQNSHWEIWHNPQMKILHHLPPRRLERQYILKLARTTGLANHALRIARLPKNKRAVMPLLTPLYFLSDTYKVVEYYLKFNQKRKEDIAIACEFEARIGRLLSPFIFWRMSQ